MNRSRLQTFDEPLAYAFARGYFDGRSKGVSNCPEYTKEEFTVVYNNGYEIGVEDYVRFDSRPGSGEGYKED